MIWLLLVALVAVAALALIVVTAVGIARLDHDFPPGGQLVETSGGRIHLVDRGPSDAPAIVLIHGASGNYRDLDVPLGQALARRWRVVVVDRPGQGSSERTDWQATAAPDRQAALIAEALSGIGVERAVILGHSLGAAVAAAFGVLYPDRTAGLAFLAPATHPWGGGGISWHNYVARWPVVGPAFCWLLVFPLGLLAMPSVIPTVFRPNEPPERYVDRIGAGLVLRPTSFRANAWDSTELLGNVQRLSPLYPRIEAPALIMAGASDPIVYNHLHAVGLDRDIAASRLTVLDGQGHMLHWTAREDVIAEVDAFMAEVAAAHQFAE